MSDIYARIFDAMHALGSQNIEARAIYLGREEIMAARVDERAHRYYEVTVLGDRLCGLPLFVVNEPSHFAVVPGAAT